jgi:hypothetical protein
VRFSRYFGVDPARLAAEGVLDPTLNVDTALFIDPMLLEQSRHVEISDGARRTYEAHFATAIKLLAASRCKDDTAWRNAARLLSFPEVAGTCLGYGSASVAGSGSGPRATASLVTTAHDIVLLGVTDPDLFAAMALFEEGFGPDRISDMTTNVIFADLLAFNERVLATLGVPFQVHLIRLKNGKTFSARLPSNPFLRGSGPIILVPEDILRALPIAKDWADISDAASHNAELRSRVNDQIAAMWRTKTLQNKEELRRWALSGKSAFETVLDMLHGANPKPYDMQSDPLGELVWRRIAEEVAAAEPQDISPLRSRDLPGICAVVEEIIAQFRFLIENRRLSEELYYQGRHRPEKSAQRLFFAVAYAYCKANDIDITPEAETGNGPVDFKISAGFAGRALVEIKLSTNTKLVAGYSRQLARYKAAEETVAGYYVVIDVGQMGKKYERLLATRNEAVMAGERASPIELVDGARRASASKL